MKKSVITLFSALLVSSAVVMNNNTAHAESDTLNQNTNAKFEIKRGPLKIANTSDLDFGTITLNGQEQTRSETAGSITINDFRGSTKGWRLTVKKQDSGFDNGIDLSFHPKSKSPDTKVTTNNNGLTINTSEQEFASVSDTNILSSSLTPTIMFNSTLKVAPTVRAKEYKTTLAWNLIDAPQ
ncbi:WxL domain-containing protein [Holzapfeliella sp. JNUCC 72]